MTASAITFIVGLILFIGGLVLIDADHAGTGVCSLLIGLAVMLFILP